MGATLTRAGHGDPRTAAIETLAAHAALALVLALASGFGYAAPATVGAVTIAPRLESPPASAARAWGDPLKPVEPRVAAVENHFQVAKPIVVLDPVLVVHALLAPQSSPEMLLHHDAVLCSIPRLVVPAIVDASGANPNMNVAATRRSAASPSVSSRTDASLQVPSSHVHGLYCRHVAMGCQGELCTL